MSETGPAPPSLGREGGDPNSLSLRRETGIQVTQMKKGLVRPFSGSAESTLLSHLVISICVHPTSVFISLVPKASLGEEAAGFSSRHTTKLHHTKSCRDGICEP